MRTSFKLLQSTDPAIYAAARGEEQRQRTSLELIPSENYAFPEASLVLRRIHDEVPALCAKFPVPGLD